MERRVEMRPWHHLESCSGQRGAGVGVEEGRGVGHRWVEDGEEGALEAADPFGIKDLERGRSSCCGQCSLQGSSSCNSSLAFHVQSRHPCRILGVPTSSG